MLQWGNVSVEQQPAELTQPSALSIVDVTVCVMPRCRKPPHSDASAQLMKFTHA